MKKIKRIAALLGAILLFGMYASTLFFGLSGSANAQNMLMASVACTIFVPVILYAITLVGRVLGGDQTSDHDSDIQTDSENHKS